MADTILTGDFTVYYEADNRQKRVGWTGSATGTRTVNELYSALQDLFDDLIQLDDGSPMSAQTPTEYTIGIIDTGDDDPWFIDNTTVEHLTGGAIQTASWTHADGTATGIVKMDYTESVALIASDKGKTIVMTTDGDSGTLLHYIDNGGTGELWIRPDTNTTANAFNNAPTADGAWTITAGTGTGTQLNGAAITGEDLWSNINTIGTIASNSHIYIEQNGALLTASEAATDWWADGQIDILVKVKEADIEIDEAVVGVYARQLTKTYSFFSTDLTSGGRTAIPLGTGTDLNTQEGVLQQVLSVTNDAFVVGDVIRDDSDATIEGVVTSYVAGTNTLQYYLIGDPLTDFGAGTGTFASVSPGTGTGTAVNSTAVNSGTIAGLSVTHASNTTFDVDENETTENYSIVIDVSDETLTDAYQWTQYVLRRGGQTTGDSDGIQGQFYLGMDFFLDYGTSSETGGTIAEGDTVTQETTGATATVIGHDTTANFLTLRNSRGTFAAGSSTDHTVTSTENSGAVEMETADSAIATAVSPNVAAPYGTFAGGTWFLARGVVLDNVTAADAQNFVTTTDDGTTVNPPNKQSLTIANTRDEDRIAVFELTAASGIIDKGQYVSAVATAGDATLGVTTGTKTAIAADTPGKTVGGILRVVDASLDIEYRIRYSSWTGTTFTFANLTGTATAGTSDTALVDTGEAFLTTVEVGDVVWSSARGYAYVTVVTDNENLVIAGGTMSGLVSTDAYEINAIPVTLTTSDNVYVPLMDVYETTGTDGSTGNEFVTITYSSDIPVLIIARNSNSTASSTTPMLPYSAEATFTSTGLSNNVIRTLDSIKT